MDFGGRLCFHQRACARFGRPLSRPGFGESPRLDPASPSSDAFRGSPCIWCSQACIQESSLASRTAGSCLGSPCWLIKESSVTQPYSRFEGSLDSFGPPEVLAIIVGYHYLPMFFSGTRWSSLRTSRSHILGYSRLWLPCHSSSQTTLLHLFSDSWQHS